MNQSISSLSFYVRFVLGAVCSFMLGFWLFSLVFLQEGMDRSDSPLVMLAPVLNVAFIFVFAWLSCAFLGAAGSCKRMSAGQPAVRWFLPALWFALAVSLIAALCFVCSFNPAGA